MIGALSAVVVTAGGIYTVVIVPQSVRIEKLEIGREKDSDQLAKLYTSIQTNDEYKKTVEHDVARLRSDIDRADAHVLRIETEQSRRTSTIASVDNIVKRIDHLEGRVEEADRKTSLTYTVGDELKNLRGELESLRQRIMVPAGASH
jgi:uncharacterized coiled-coil DUF342 family protein